MTPNLWTVSPDEPPCVTTLVTALEEAAVGAVFGRAIPMLAYADVVRRVSGSRSFLGQSRLAQALDNPLEIVRVLVRQHLAALLDGVIRVDAR